MTKKKLTFLSVSLFATCGAVAAVASTSETLKIIAAGAEQWNHYSAVAPTMDKRGSREYWVSCSSHESVFVKPESGNIVEKGTPTEDFVRGLAANDPRSVKSLNDSYVLTFDDASDKNYFSSLRGTTFNVQDGKLVVETTGSSNTSDLIVSASYLKAIFADPNVTGFTFEISSSANVTYVAHKPSTSGTAVAYPYYDSTYPLSTNTQTWFFSRSDYDNNNTGAVLLWVVNGPTFTLDKFTPVNTAENVGGLEFGGFATTSNGDMSFRSKCSGAFKEQLTAYDKSGMGGLTYSYDYTTKTEGSRSIKITKQQSQTIEIAAPWLGNQSGLLVTGKVLAFDMYTTSAYNSNTGYAGIADGSGKPLYNTSNYQQPANKWVTYRLPRANVASWGLFLKFNASTGGDIYIDNLRIEDENVNLFGFEEHKQDVLRVSTTDWVVGTSTNVNFTCLVKDDGSNLSINDVRLTKDYHSEGTQSLLVDRVSNKGWSFFYVSPATAQALRDQNKKLSIDVYSTIAASASNFVSGKETTITSSFHKAYQWQTYVIDPNTEMTPDGRCLIIRGSTQGYWMFDNLQFVD